MRFALLLLLIGLTLTQLSGCSYLAVAAELVTPPEKVEAKYKLPDKATLVIVDDPRGLVNSPSTLRRIAAATRGVLEIEKVVVDGGFIGQDQLASYRETLGEDYSRTTLAKLGIELEAKQVIHVEVTGFQIAVGGDVIRPGIAMNVKVFDLDERVRTFPRGIDPETGIDSGATVYSLQSQTPSRDVTGQSAARSVAVRELADQAGRDVARLFFTWRRPAVGADLGSPQ